MIYTFFNEELVPTNVQDSLKQLFQCKDFSHSNRLLGYSCGRGTTWFLNTQAELGMNVVLRHYYRGGLFGKLVKDSYFFSNLEQTRAFKEFTLLKQMHQWNLPVPRPIAFQIKKSACFYRADILLEKIESTQDLSKLLQTEKLSLTQYQQIGTLIRQLHQHQIHHSDLNIHNILFDDKQRFWLIDFDKCGIEQGENWKQDNLNRLLRSFHKEQTRLNIQFSEQDWQALLAGYHG